MRLSPPLVMGGLIGGGMMLLFAAGGVFVGYTMLLGKAEAVVWNSGDEPLTVSIDGVPTQQIAAGKHARIAVPQGDHVITTQQDYPVRVDGFSTVLVPTSPSQCFAEVDVSHVYQNAPRKTPLVVDIFPGDKAIAVSMYTKFRLGDLGDEIKQGLVPKLMVPVPCQGLSKQTAQAYVEAERPF